MMAPLLLLLEIISGLTDDEEDLTLLESVDNDFDQVDYMFDCLVDKER